MKLSLRGFTLVELLIAVSIISVAGILLAQLVIQNNGLVFQQTAKVSHGVGLNNTKVSLSNDLKPATAIVSGYPLSSPTYTSSSTSIVIQVPSIDSSGNVIANTYDYIAYYKDPSNSKILRKNYFPDPASSKKSKDQVLLTETSLLQFIYLDSGGMVVSPSSAARVVFTIKTSTQIGFNKQEASASGEVELRNN